MGKWLVIADDFTGANDTGVQLTKRGLETQVVLEGKAIVDPEKSYVLDTESRNIDGEQAYKEILNHLEEVVSSHNQVIYKKIDSTLRGNITNELKALDDFFKPELIIFAPAFPIIGRTTIDGIHYVNGKRITETEFSKDPIKPVREDNIKKLLEKDYKEDISHHKLSVIREDKIDLLKSRIHTFDAEEDDDLEKIVKTALATNKKILWVGSAGLANTIIKIKRPFKPSLALVGSMSDISRKQMQYAKNQGTEILNINISKMLESEDIEEYVQFAIKTIQDGKDLIITSSYYKDNYIEAMAKGKDLSISKEDIGNRVKEVLGDICKEVIRVEEVSGLFLTGGDTAIGFIYSTGASGSDVIDEITTGIPLIKLNGGEFDGLKMITKAGAFGDEDTLFYAMEKLKEDKE